LGKAGAYSERSTSYSARAKNTFFYTDLQEELKFTNRNPENMKKDKKPRNDL
jgi:hypothetical protein